jgi:hypothetical protein
LSKEYKVLDLELMIRIIEVFIRKLIAQIMLKQVDAKHGIESLKE